MEYCENKEHFSQCSHLVNMDPLVLLLAHLISDSYSDDSHTLQCFDLLFSGSNLSTRLHILRAQTHEKPGRNTHSMLTHTQADTCSVVNKQQRAAQESSLLDR